MNNLRRRALLSASSGGIDPTAGRGTIGDYEFVDLGLPSGLLWATCNVGANSETDYGNYYQWGAGSTTYKVEDQYYNGTTISSTYDTATQVMGSRWRMPKSAELEELVNNTNYEWIINFNGSGINGGIYISKTNPKAYVFFPAAGRYPKYSGGSLVGEGSYSNFWGSQYISGSTAWAIVANTAGGDTTTMGKNNGLSVRGVHAAV